MDTNSEELARSAPVGRRVEVAFDFPIRQVADLAYNNPVRGEGADICKRSSPLPLFPL